MPTQNHQPTKLHPVASSTQEFPPLTKQAVCNNSLLHRDPNSLFLEKSRPLHSDSPFLLINRAFNLFKDSPISPM